MEEHHATVFSNQTGISARVCPRGHVYLSVGHTCLTLRRGDFLDLAQVVRAAENHLLEDKASHQGEQTH